MSTLTVALLQIAAPGTEPSANLDRGIEACREAAAAGADLALFPEMWSTGYEWDEGEPGRTAVTPDGAFLAAHRALAAELEMAIALTYLESWPGGPRNSVSVIGRDGRIALTYAKVHTCDFDSERALTAGCAFPVAALDTTAGPVRIGAMICFDVLFPEAARALMLGGAEVVLVPNASAHDANHLIALRTRAHENMIGVALANYPAPQQTGRSTAVDAVAYRFDPADRDAGTACDPILVLAGPDEGIHLARFDLDRLRAFRRLETQGNAYRRPDAYSALVSPEVAAPFVREDARR
jgi:N-carbamoylputrescine amidase